MPRERADAKRLGCVMSRIDDRELVLLSVDGGPMGTLTNDEGVDFHLTCFLESFGRRTGASANCPSPCLAVPSNWCRPYLAPVILHEFSSSLSKCHSLDLTLSAHADEDSFEPGERRAWCKAKRLREEHVVAKGCMPIERQMR